MADELIAVTLKAKHNAGYRKWHPEKPPVPMQFKVRYFVHPDVFDEKVMVKVAGEGSVAAPAIAAVDPAEAAKAKAKVAALAKKAADAAKKSKVEVKADTEVKKDAPKDA